MVRQGLVNLQRPGNQSAAVLTALGLGVMLMMTIYYVQHAIVRDLNLTSGSSNIPNVFLVDVGADELAGVKKLIAAQPAVQGGLETIPIVSARILSIDGVSTDQLRIQHYPRRMLRSTSLTWADTVPIGEKIVDGRWWTKNTAAAQVAVSERTAKTLHLKGWLADWIFGRRQANWHNGGCNLSFRWPACVFAQPIYLAKPHSGRPVGGLVWRFSCGPSACRRGGEEFVRGLSHGDRDQHGGCAGGGPQSCGSDRHDSSICGGLCSADWGHHSGLKRDRNAFSASARGRDFEIAGRAAESRSSPCSVSNF